MATDLSLNSLLDELKGLQNEIKNRRAELKKFNDRVKIIKEQIGKFCKEKNLPGVKDQKKGIALVIEKKTQRKKKGEIKQNMLNVLRHYMDDSKATKILTEMTNSGDKETKEIMKIVQI